MKEGAVSQGPSDAGGSEPSLATDGGVEVLHLRDLRRRDHLDDHLRDPVAGLHGEVGVRVVEEDDAHGAAVVSVDHAGAHVDGVLQR